MPRKTREERIEAWTARIQPSVAYCTHCQPKDEGEVLWVLGNKISVGDLLADFRVPEDIQDTVAEGLVCNWCGEGEFSTYDDIGLLTAEEKAYNKRHRALTEKYAPKIRQFGDFLSQYPYLGGAHPLGREIRRMVAKYKATRIEPATWWRARRAEGAVRFGARDMRPPSKRRAVSEGRFNHFGQRVFYLSADPETALAETLDCQRKEVLGWVQRFRMPAVSDVLDLIGPDWYDEEQVPLLALGLLSHMDNLAPPHDSPWKPEYFVPRYIADCARESGFKAIRFRSTRAWGVNLVLFDWDSRAPRPVGKPESRVFVPKEPEF